MKVLVCTPCFGGLLTTEYFLSFMKSAAAAAQEGIQLGVFTLKNESLIPRARNRCVTQVLSQDWDKLMFIDADIEWSWEQLRRVLMSGAPIVGGTYPKKTFPLELNFTPEFLHTGFFENGSRSLEAFRDWAEGQADENGEIPVRHLPTGFLCIHREVFEKLIEAEQVSSYRAADAPLDEPAHHYDFFQSGARAGEYLSEDWSFCELAVQNGFPVILNAKVIVGHVGSHKFEVLS